MGLTAIGIIYSPWSRQSGAQMNPAVTLTFLCLGKIKPWDATLYIAAQFVGGVCIWTSGWIYLTVPVLGMLLAPSEALPRCNAALHLLWIPTRRTWRYESVMSAVPAARHQPAGFRAGWETASASDHAALRISGLASRIGSNAPAKLVHQAEDAFANLKQLLPRLRNRCFR